MLPGPKYAETQHVRIPWLKSTDIRQENAFSERPETKRNMFGVSPKLLEIKPTLTSEVPFHVEPEFIHLAK